MRMCLFVVLAARAAEEEQNFLRVFSHCPYCDLWPIRLTTIRVEAVAAFFVLLMLWIVFRSGRNPAGVGGDESLELRDYYFDRLEDLFKAFPDVKFGDGAKYSTLKDYAEGKLEFHIHLSGRPGGFGEYCIVFDSALDGIIGDGDRTSPPHARFSRSSPENASNLRLLGGEGRI
jgi:hypothetical protein